MALLSSGLTTQEIGALLWRQTINDNWVLIGNTFGAVGAAAIKLLDDTDSPYTATFDNRYMLCNAASGAITINLPTAASGNAGRAFTVKKNDSSANAVTIDPNGAELIQAQATVSLQKIHESITFISDGTNWVIIEAQGVTHFDQRHIGDLTTGAIAITGGSIYHTSLVPSALVATFSGINVTWRGKAEIRNNDSDADTLSLYHDFDGSNPIHSRVQMARVPTTDATVTTLWTYTIPSGEMVVVEAMVAGNSTGAGNHAGVSMWGVFFNNGGTVSQQGTTQGTAQVSGGYAIAFDVTGATVRVRVTGGVAQNVEWQGAMKLLADVPIG